jgi:pyruvate/2-oxoglutarate dehydrogenase complex dihydrolipoamide acyltransferase (E2) component
LKILLPKLGFSMNEGTLAEWLVKDGDRIEKGQPLLSLESEKSVQEIPAPATGVVHIIVTAGETCEVGTVLGEIGSEVTA